MAAVNQPQGDLDIDVASLFAALWRAKFKILIASLVITGLAAAAVLTVSPKYKAETRIVIAPGESVLTRLDTGNIDENRPLIEPDGLGSEVELMGSGDLLGQVAEKLALARMPEFNPSNLSLTDKIMTALGRAPELGLNDTVIAKMRDHLKVYRVENSRVIVIEFSSKDPKLAASVPQEIAAAYLATQKETKKSKDSLAADEFLLPVIEKLRVEVNDAEAKVADYRSRNDILPGQNNTELATQQLSELTSEMTRVRAARASAEAKAQSIRAMLDSGGSIDAFPEILSSGLVQRLREQQVNLKSQIADLSNTLLDNHPRMKGLRSQLADLDRQIVKEVAKVLGSIESEARTAGLREKELAVSVNQLKAESSRVEADGVGLQALEREATAKRDQLASYLTRYNEAKSRDEYQVPDARIFAKAQVPSEPYFPKFLPTVGAAFAGALIILSVLTLLKELFSGRALRSVAYQPMEAEQRVAANDAPAFASAEPAPVVVEQPKPQPSGPVIDPELAIETVADRLVDEGHSCAVVISPEGDRASASSVLLARRLADQGLKVVLLDLTANSAAARPMTDGLALPGITNLLAGSSNFGGIIHNDVYSDAHVIPTGNADAAKAAKAVERLPMVINALVEAYDMVLVECGPSTVAGVRRLVVPGSSLLVSVIDPAHKAALSTMTELISAGYEDLILVSPLGAPSNEPLPGRSAA